MKLHPEDHRPVRLRSPPSRGAWIEIEMDKLDQKLAKVAPLTGGVD